MIAAASSFVVVFNIGKHHDSIRKNPRYLLLEHGPLLSPALDALGNGLDGLDLTVCYLVVLAQFNY